jgi:hypothetical protein
MWIIDLVGADTSIGMSRDVTEAFSFKARVTWHGVTSCVTSLQQFIQLGFVFKDNDARLKGHEGMLCKRAANSNTHDGSMVLVDMLT